MKKIFTIFLLLFAACTTEPVEVHDDNAVLQKLFNDPTIECAELPDSICVWENGRIIRLTQFGENISGEIPDDIGSLSELTILGLKSTNLYGSIPESIGNLSQLTQLSLSDNLLGCVEDSCETFCDGGNGCSRTIPESIGNLKKLTLLDISHNQLTGSIPKTIGELTALHTFLADSNNLIGTIPDDICTIYPNFINYDLSGNQFCPPLPSCIDTPDDIGFQNCDNSCGTDNTFLEGYCYSSADLSALGAFVNISSVTEDSLILGKQEWYAGRLEILDCYWQEGEIDTCHLSGDLPANLGNLSALKYLDLQKSSLSGVLPLSVGNLSKLEYLYLQDNSISGSLPDTIGGMVNLKDFSIANNQLSGSIPESIGNLTELTNLDLQNNKLTGELPESISNLTNLTYLNISENQLDGSIPDDICTIYSNSTNMDVSNNKFCPPLPDCIDTPDLLGYQECEDCGEGLTQLNGYCYSQSDLDVLQSLINNADSLNISMDIDIITGVQPLELGIQEWHTGRIEILDCFWDSDSCNLSSEFPTAISDLESLKYLDLQHNNLRGEFPESIGDLTNLTYLNISENQLEGVIPEGICNLSNLQWGSTFSNTASTLFNNQFCPPYPECIAPFVGEQDTTNCSQSGSP